MGRIDLERLSKDELIELVLKLQRPEKTSRTSSKPPSTDRKARRDQSRPGGAKPGHQGHSRVLAEKPDAVIEHRPACCPDCGLALPPELAAETVSVHEQIELPRLCCMDRRAGVEHRPASAVMPGGRTLVVRVQASGSGR